MSNQPLPALGDGPGLAVTVTSDALIVVLYIRHLRIL